MNRILFFWTGLLVAFGISFSYADTVGAGADMKISVTSITDTSVVVNGRQYNAVAAGDSLKYLVRIQNQSSYQADSIYVTQVLPDAARFSESNYPPIVSTGNNLIWSFNQLEPGTDLSWIVTLKVNNWLDAAVENLISQGFVTARNDTFAVNNSDTDTTRVIIRANTPDNYDLSADLTAQTDTTVQRGGQTVAGVRVQTPFVYRLNVTNHGPGDATGVNVNYTLPDGVSYNTAAPAPDAVNSNVLSWQFELDAGADTTMLVEAYGTFLAETSATATLRVHAALDTLADNNTVSETVWFLLQPEDPDPRADLRVQLDASGDTTINVFSNEWPGFFKESRCRYTLQVLNQGPDAAENVTVKAVIAPEVYTDAYSQAPAETSGDTLIWYLADVAAAETWQQTVDVRLRPGIDLESSPFALDAHLISSSAMDTVAENNSQSTRVYVLQKPQTIRYSNVRLDWSVQTDSFTVSGQDTSWYADAGDTISYSFRLYNAGEATATSVFAGLKFDSRLTLQSAMPQPVHVLQDSVAWTYDSLAVNQTAQITINATLPETLPVGTNSFLTRMTVTAANEAPNTSSSHEMTVINVTEQIAADFSPQLEVSPNVIDVSDSAQIRVQFPVEISEWSLTIELADGQLIQDFADAFILNTAVTPDTWYDVQPKYSHKQLVSGAPEEQVIFTVQAISTSGASGQAQATLTIHSSNDMVLDRNVFRPQVEAPLNIEFQMAAAAQAELELYDVSGRRITALGSGFFNGGWNTLSWNGDTEDGQPVGSGVYLITLSSDHANQWKKVIIVR